MKSPYNERALRLECLKIAASLTSQLKQRQDGVVVIAKQFLAFVTAADKDDDYGDDDTDTDVDTNGHAGPEPADRYASRYTLRDLRRRA